MLTILIPGLVLVGIMIWASTRIKRNAAQAFEREMIETPEFSLTKPEGFLALADPPDGLLFSAYTKDFGVDAAERIRRATAELRSFRDADVNSIIERVKIDSTETVSEQTGVIGGRKCANIVVERLEDSVPLESHYRIIAGPEAVYQLVVTILPEYKEELQPKIDEMLGSFSLS